MHNGFGQGKMRKQAGEIWSGAGGGNWAMLPNNANSLNPALYKDTQLESHSY